jgi:DNA polymerase-3 subunit epsilon
MYLFFDTETNGKPKKFGAKVTDLDNWPRVTQLAWKFVDGKGHAQDFSYFIKPDGWTIPKEKFFIDNGHSTEICEAKGEPMAYVLRNFIGFYERSVLLIAHNIKFDNPVLGAEMLRYKTRPESGIIAKLCTMETTTNICKLPNEKGAGYKWPKLQELHSFLFGSEFGNAHEAMADVNATAKCFFELKDRGLL